MSDRTSGSEILAQSSLIDVVSNGDDIYLTIIEQTASPTELQSQVKTPGVFVTKLYYHSEINDVQFTHIFKATEADTLLNGLEVAISQDVR